jgi:hypothetical protein
MDHSIFYFNILLNRLVSISTMLMFQYDEQSTQKFYVKRPESLFISEMTNLWLASVTVPFPVAFPPPSSLSPVYVVCGYSLLRTMMPMVPLPWVLSLPFSFSLPCVYRNEGLGS